MSFNAQLTETCRSQRSTLCIGLDPILERLPAGIERSPAGVLHFNRLLIEATADLVCAYKPNSAFYEALGSAGWDVLKATIAAVPAHIPVILDAKRGDIGSTAQAYAQAAFDELGATAITLNPYLGPDALTPFLQRQDKGCFILCRTSNAQSNTLQNLVLHNKLPLYIHLAQLAATEWNTYQNCGLVAGATHITELEYIHNVAPQLPLLVPGVGAQGGNVEQVLQAAGSRAIIAVSRAIIYAEHGSDWQAAARHQAQSYQKVIANTLTEPLA